MQKQQIAPSAALKNEDDYLLPITDEDIKATFYYQISLALEFYKDKNFVTKSDIKNKPPFLFPADGGGLPALVFIYVMERSKTIKNGLLIIEDKIVKKENCPPLYQDKFDLLLKAKEAVNALSEADRDSLIRFCLRKSKDDVYDDDEDVSKSLDEDKPVPDLVRKIGGSINVLALAIRSLNKDVEKNLYLLLDAIE